MSKCELVENEAGGKKFKYCRTHKVEEKDCPKLIFTSSGPTTAPCDPATFYYINGVSVSKETWDAYPRASDKTKASTWIVK